MWIGQQDRAEIVSMYQEMVGESSDTELTDAQVQTISREMFLSSSHIRQAISDYLGETNE